MKRETKAMENNVARRIGACNRIGRQRHCYTTRLVDLALPDDYRHRTKGVITSPTRRLYIARIMTPARRSASREAITPPADLPMGSAADAPHGSRPEQVYARLRDLIVEGLLAPGSRIVETEIASRLGVSRTPVREALQRLQQEGYVMGSPGAQQSRLTVAPLTQNDVYELLNIVGALEGMGARGAASAPQADRRNAQRATSRHSTPSSSRPARRRRSITAVSTTSTTNFIAGSSRRVPAHVCSRCTTR